MNMTRRIVLGLCATGLAVLVGPSSVGNAQGAKPLVDAKNLRMSAEHGMAAVPVFGDPSKPGMYVYRNRFGPGATSRPHFHDQDRWVTVIKGTWHTAEGDVFTPSKMVPIKTGGFMFHPAGLHHYDGSQDGEEVIVQIMGMGPVKTTQTEVDANGKPVTPAAATPD